MLVLTFRTGDRRGETVEPRGARFIVGRDPGCELLLRDTKVSRQHAAFTVTANGRLLLGDLGSSNGTFVDGVQLTSVRELRGGERLRFGDTVLDVGHPGHVPEGGLPEPGRDRPRKGRLARRLRRGPPLLVLGLLVAAGAVAAAIIALRSEDSPSREGSAVALATVAPATVRISTMVGGRRTSSASGWVLDAERGLVATNAHVVNFQPRPGRVAIEVLARGRSRRGELVAVSPCEDLAVVRVDPPAGISALRLGDQARLSPGTRVIAAGYPGGDPPARNLVTTESRVLRSGGPVPEPLEPGAVRLRNVIQIGATLSPGVSGGPLVDLRGVLVGVVTLAGAEGGERRAYAIGVDRARGVLRGLAGGRSRAWPGAAFEVLRRPRSRKAAGLLLTASFAGRRAGGAGLGRRAWLLEAVDGRRVGTTLDGYCRVAGRKTSGDRARFGLVAVRRQRRGGYVRARDARRTVIDVRFQ
jgi:S1-C subfamily serine protease